MKKTVIICLALAFMLYGCKKTQTPAEQSQKTSSLKSPLNKGGGEVSNETTPTTSTNQTTPRIGTPPPDQGHNFRKPPLSKSGGVNQETSKEVTTAMVERKHIYPPKIKYIASTVKTKDNDNVIKQGEKITLNITVENIGRGSAEDVSAKIDTDNNIIPDFNVLYLPAIAPGKVRWSGGTRQLLVLT